MLVVPVVMTVTAVPVAVVPVTVVPVPGDVAVAVALSVRVSHVLGVRVWHGVCSLSFSARGGGQWV